MPGDLLTGLVSASEERVRAPVLAMPDELTKDDLVLWYRGGPPIWGSPTRQDFAIPEGPPAAAAGRRGVRATFACGRLP
jgi:hypothetical protein